MTQPQHMKIVASAIPESIADFQLALDAAFAGGIAYGSAKASLTNEVKWTPVDERLPDPDFWMVTVDTENGPMVQVLELDDNGNWIHEGEPTFCHGYQFTPTHWAPVPSPAKEEQEFPIPF